jgi:hypothetical protein
VTVTSFWTNGTNQRNTSFTKLWENKNDYQITVLAHSSKRNCLPQTRSKRASTEYVYDSQGEK